MRARKLDDAKRPVARALALEPANKGVLELQRRIASHP
jgi:hypothetical protein